MTFPSFDLGRIASVRALEPWATTGAIFGRGAAEAPAAAAAVSASGIGPAFRLLFPKVLAAARALSLAARAWNPDADADMAAVLALGPDGVSTNFPDRLLRLLGRGPGAR